MNIERLKEIVGESFVITDRSRMQSYLSDETVATIRPPTGR